MNCEIEFFGNWIEGMNSLTFNRDNSALSISTNVSIGDRGLIARRPLSNDACVLSINMHDPRLVLTPRRALALLPLCHQTRLSHSSSSSPRHILPQDALALFFYHFKICDAKNSCPLWFYWKPYIDVLPKTFTDVAYACQVYSEICESLTLPYSLKVAVTKQSNRFISSFQRCFPSTVEASKEAYAWAWSMVNSRCVYCKLNPVVEGKMASFPIAVEVDCAPIYSLVQHKDANMAVIPFFDFFNHSPGVATKLVVVHDVLNLLTSGNYDIGDQVFINYGSHDNLFLFCEYGFVIPGCLNSDDAIYPSYQDFVATIPKNDTKRLHNALKELQLEYGDNRTWKSVFLSSKSGPSYYLVLILFAVFSEGFKSRVDLFCLDETERSPPVTTGLQHLITTMQLDHQLASQRLCLLVHGEKEQAFIKLLESLLASRLALLSNVLQTLV